MLKYITECHTAKYYAGVIEEVLASGELRMSYLRKKTGSAAQLVYPDIEDSYVISTSSVAFSRAHIYSDNCCTGS